MFALTTHSKHVILGIILAVCTLCITWKVVSHLDGVAHDKVVLDKAKLDADNQLAKQQANQSVIDSTKKQQADAATQAQLNALALSNAQLKTEVQNLTNQLANQRKQDAAANPQQLSTRWLELIAGVGDVKPTVDGVSVSLPAAHATVDALEEVPVLKQENKEISDNSAKKDDTIQKQQDSLTTTNKLLTDKVAELNTCTQKVKDADKTCNDQKAEIRATAVKHGIVYNVLSFLAGLVVEHKLKI